MSGIHFISSTPCIQTATAADVRFRVVFGKYDHKVQVNVTFLVENNISV